MSVFEYEAPFTPVRPRKKRKNRVPEERPDQAVVLARTIEELASGGWISQCTQLLREAMQTLAAQAPPILCLGLGSPSSSRDARAQLAFLLAACDDLTLERSTASAYDPVFTDEDAQLLATVKVQRLTEDQARSPPSMPSAGYPLEEPTIVYMPHCDLRLYENLLRENCSQERLPRLLLIANRLSEYVDSIPSHKLDAEYPCVSRLGQSAAVTPASCAPVADTRPIFFIAATVATSPATHLVTAAAVPGLPQRVQQPRRVGDAAPARGSHDSNAIIAT
ncbi:hypothetical protein PHLGIDRAFT_120409 [Phlebiopsis gigantea 11061_1 CR5-6]|uniref:SRR1-like domain-containing protein n=1 Tax=Phlebiopsis gigantea (strain 11061_1 CR5-6) TaxID=745531 RepID=A0A0C3S420_PHLG1|nr:hypothetical protein PHLGIDRAFT_120409 [Phlebiopsis gigantea 11061_1 CR5-6]